ncbi:uncharacterized protein LOC121867423 [Homarus americanus]|uniref:uncharacterized protein LOC121867423 n=1 Tax=Homarus americanus TaxID=6706 RepID=UPI001C451CAF|nr:uncharacterized protein LOC121867423 [Homarus americanus]
MRKTVMLTPVKHPPEPSCVSGLSSLSQVILETLTTSSRCPRHERRQQTIPQRKTVDPSGYYKEVYYRQFQAEPEAQPGCTQLMYSQLMSDKATQVKRNTIQAPASTKAAERTEPGRVQWPVCGGGAQEAESEQITPCADDSAAVEGWPSHLDNVSDFVIQQQDIRYLGDENLEDYNWRNFHGKESSSSKKYFSNKDDVEVDHTDERQETSVRSPVRILDQEAHNETQSKFSFKKIATRIIHTIPHIGEKNSNVHDLEATPQDDLMLAPQWPQKCHDPCDEVSNDMNMHNRNLNETAFGVLLFDLSLSPILGLSPIHKTSILSHLQPESHVNTNMTLDVVTTEDTLGDGIGGFINDIGLNSDVTIVHDNGAIELAPVAQKSVFLCRTPPRAEITDDTQEETNCTKDLQNNTIEKSNLNSEVVLDIGCDVSHSTNELQPKELISDVSEKCSIPSVLASAGNRNTAVTGFEVDLVKDPDTSGTNKNARPQPKFASNTNSTNWQVKERETHEELFVVKLGATKVSELETSTSKPSLFVKDNSKHKQENIFPLQSRKSTFKVPFKRVSESPIVGYPVNKKHITSTPKDMYQSKLKGFGKSGERHSSSSSAGAFNIKGKEKGLHTHHQPCAGQETQPLSKLQHPWTEARDAGFDEASVSKKQFALKSKFLKKLKDFKIPTRNPQFSQSVNSHCLHNNNNNEKIPNENREQTPVKFDPIVKTSQFPSRASKINFLRENPVERANNSFEAKTSIDNVLGNRTTNKDNISNVGKSFKEKLSKFEHSPEMTNMDAEAIVKRKAMYDNCVSEEVAENEGNLISSPGKDNLEGLKVPQENSDHNVDMVVDEIHKGLKKKANVRVSSNKCWEKKASKRKKAVEDKDKKVTKKMRKDNGEKLLSRENEDKTKQVNTMIKFNLKEKKIKQPKKDKMTSKATSKPTEKFQNKNKIGNKEEKATKSIEKTKIAVSADKVPVSLPLSQTSGPEHVLGRDTELFVILDFIAAASEICFTLLYRNY